MSVKRVKVQQKGFVLKVLATTGLLIIYEQRRFNGIRCHGLIWARKYFNRVKLPFHWSPGTKEYMSSKILGRSRERAAEDTNTKSVREFIPRS